MRTVEDAACTTNLGGSTFAQHYRCVTIPADAFRIDSYNCGGIRAIEPDDGTEGEQRAVFPEEYVVTLKESIELWMPCFVVVQTSIHQLGELVRLVRDQIEDV